MRTIFFNAHHAPIGAFASFTLGAKGASGGLGLELGRPSGQSIYIGAETHTQGRFKALPFYGEARNIAEDYNIEAGQKHDSVLTPYADEDISRTMGPCFDTWKAEDLTVRIISPVMPVPEPGLAAEEELTLALCPAVLVELTLDNTDGARARAAFIGFNNNERSCGMRHISGDLTGIAAGRSFAMICPEGDMVSGNAFNVEDILAPKNRDHLNIMLGENMLLMGEAPAGEVKTFQVAVCFYREGFATTGIDASYLYTRYFLDVESVGAFALASFSELVDRAEQAERSLEHPGLNPSQRFMLAHSVRSYYGSTQLLQWEDEPVWVVNEGEYRMINTFDLTADQLFFELRMNPWTTRNVLDMYVERYAYIDSIGGQEAIGFTHDMGVSNQWSRPQHSSYERPELSDCFSYMTHEELLNWVLCAGVYGIKADDGAWLAKHRGTLRSCLASLCLRDHPDPSKRNGIMSVDSPRCGQGAEITTYDSLDESLGQARANTYIAIKSLAAYILLEGLVENAELAAVARSQAEKVIASVLAAVKPDGTIPALLEGSHPSRIIPIVEGLIFVREAGLWDDWASSPGFARLVDALQVHLQAVLKEGICLFPGGAWKLSSTSTNSWLSKIYLCQHIARTLLGMGSLGSMEQADAQHVEWLLHPESLNWAWSDQCVDGVARGSRYYPRGVTSALWLAEA